MRPKKGGSMPPISRSCSHAQRTKQMAERPPTGQARGTKRAALRLPFCARAARLEGQQNRRTANGQGRQVHKKGVSTPPILRTCSQAQRTGKTVSLYHYITITCYSDIPPGLRCAEPLCRFFGGWRSISSLEGKMKQDFVLFSLSCGS